MSVGADGLEPGRAYRLEITGHRRAGAGDQPVAQVRITWDRGGDAGDECFPFPREGGSWLAPVLGAPPDGYVEFRAPAEGEILFTALAPTGDVAGVADYAWRFVPTGPAIPGPILRPISQIGALAQDRCRLLDLKRWTKGLVPLPARSSTQDTRPGGRPGIAFIGSRELRGELAFDADVDEVDEGNWKDLLHHGKFEYLLIEPVLHIDHVSWRHAMARGGDRRTLQQVLRRCREIGLPVVLWLRVEPEAFGEFSWLVPLADRVYAVDAVIQRMVVAGHPAADPKVLPPCVQPRLHNPMCNHDAAGLRAKLAGNVLLDGWWHLAAGAGARVIDELQSERLLVAESEGELSFTRLGTLPRFRWNMMGCLDGVEKSLLSRLVGAELFLPDDALPRWRREQMMLRAAACGSVVLFRNESLGSTLIDKELCLHGDDGTLLSAIPRLIKDPLAHARWRHRVVRDVLQNHTYRARLSQIARDLSVGEEPLPPPKVACLLVSMRPWLLDSCIRRFQSDLYPEKELIIVVHGSPATAREMAIRSGGDDRIRIFQLGKARSLGACLNFAAMQTDAPFWAKFDDDDLYGPRYLSDMMLYQQVADSDLLAKPPAFIYLEDRDELRWHGQRAARAWMHHPTGEGEATAGIAGGTLVGKRGLLEKIPFSETRRGGSDSDLVLRARAAGFDLMVTDPFNFTFFRSEREGFHTWSLDSEKLRRRSVKVGNAESLDSAVFV